MELLFDRLHAAKIAPGNEQGLRALAQLRRGEQVHLQRAQQDGVFFRVGSGGSGRLRVATQRGMAMHSRAHVMMVFGLSTSRSS